MRNSTVAAMGTDVSALNHKRQNLLFLAGRGIPKTVLILKHLYSCSQRGFWQASVKARRTVPSPTPNSPAIEPQESPCERRATILERSTGTRGRPSRFPLALAEAIPDLTRSRISSHSNSAMLAEAG